MVSEGLTIDVFMVVEYSSDAVSSFSLRGRGRLMDGYCCRVHRSSNSDEPRSNTGATENDEAYDGVMRHKCIGKVATCNGN